MTLPPELSDPTRLRELVVTGAELFTAIADLNRRGARVESATKGQRNGQWRLRIRWPQPKQTTMLNDAD
jgi:hypothetical protein